MSAAGEAIEAIEDPIYRRLRAALAVA